MYILGISAFYHDSAACIVHDGNILAAAQEERFTRKKHDSSFPLNAVKYCLQECNLNISDIEFISYYEDSQKKFFRLLKTYLGSVPYGSQHFVEAMRVWLNKKLFIKRLIYKELKNLNPKKQLPRFTFYEHHQSHAAAAFYPSPFKESVILCMDGVGEWTTSSAWIGKDKKIYKLWEIKFPHSLGLIYSAFTAFCGFKVNSGEYKLMGLAPYGKPIYAELIKKELIKIESDGSFTLNLKYFIFHHNFKMTNKNFSDLFKIEPREPESEIDEKYLDIAASIQNVVSEIVLKISKKLSDDTGIKNLCLSGGVALNCVANGDLINKNYFNDLWIQPAAGDAGSCIGAALLKFYENNERIIDKEDSMQGSYLGPSFKNEAILNSLKASNLIFNEINQNELFKEIATLIDQGNIIGLFNGRMEFGPRALGNRSIIGDPRNKDMQSKMNLKIKFRESFRPFAPAVLEEECSNYFKLNKKSPYMLLVSQIRDEYKLKIEDKETLVNGLERLKVNRSMFPAITHVDYSARIQTVNKKNNHFFYSILKAFYELTNCPILINTSFNIRGEPIVNTIEDALRCFMHTNMDVLVIENYILKKKDQVTSSFKFDNKYRVKFD